MLLFVCWICANALGVGELTSLIKVDKGSDSEHFETLKILQEKPLKMKCHLLFDLHEGAFDATSAESCFCVTQLTEPSNFLRASESLRNKAKYVCIDYGLRVRARMFSMRV